MKCKTFRFHLPIGYPYDEMEIAINNWLEGKDIEIMHIHHVYIERSDSVYLFIVYQEYTQPKEEFNNE